MRPLWSEANLAQPAFTADVAGTYVISLVVTGPTGTSAAATVTISALQANLAPVANARGSRSVVAGTTVFLNGSLSSDQNVDPLSYQWPLTRPLGSSSILAGTTTVSPSFAPNVAGSYVVTLVVSDGMINSAPSTINMTVTSSSVICCRHCTTGNPVTTAAYRSPTRVINLLLCVLDHEICGIQAPPRHVASRSIPLVLRTDVEVQFCSIAPLRPPYKFSNDRNARADFPDRLDGKNSQRCREQKSID